MKKIAIISLFAFLFLFKGFAQTPIDYPPKISDRDTSITEITLKDGTKIRGKILSQDAQKCKIVTPQMGEVTIAVSLIMETKQLSATVVDSIFAPHSLQLSGTGYCIEKGRWEYANTMLYYSEFTGGIAKNLQVSAGFITFLPSAFINLSLKATVVQQENFTLALQGSFWNINYDGLTFGFTSRGNSSIKWLGVAASFGKIGENNVTLGISKPLGEGSDGFMLNVGFMGSSKKKNCFINDSHFIITNSSDVVALLANGIRFNRPRHAFDLVAYIPINPSKVFEIPLVIVPTVTYRVKISK